MHMTEKSLAASDLGSDPSMLQYSAFADSSPERRPKIVERLETLQLDPPTTLPDDIAGLKAGHNDLVNRIWRCLEQSRVQMGGDAYALPFFVLNFSLFGAITRLALGMEAKDRLTLVSAALLDLGIDSQEKELRRLLRIETEWIQRHATADDVQVEVSEVVQVWGRIGNRIMELWRVAERRRASDLGTPDLNYTPTYSCFVRYSHTDEEFCRRLTDWLKLRGIRVWVARDDGRGGEKLVEQIDD